MEPSDLNVMGSLRRGGSVWRRSGSHVDDVFSRSATSRGEADDDEEALRWAALEKLPTYDRVRRGILSLEAGQGQEIVDVDKLGTQQRIALVERLIRVADEDNETFLLKFKNRIDRVGIELPTIEVRFQNLSIEALAYVGSQGLPSFINFFTNALENFLSAVHLWPSRKKPLPVLHDISGIIKPHRMTLLLGPPGSGKTSLLLALAGKLDSDLKVTGDITYNGHAMNEFVPRRTAAYISQYDLHTGEMTVRETLAFSARCQGVGSQYDMLTELARREKAANIKPDPDIDIYMKASAVAGSESNIVTDYVLKILGLSIVADTLVGNEMIRGISGGQKKRVTTGEMLVGQTRALFMDEISTGLDSSTTFQIVNCLRQSIHILGSTAVISLLQPAPETYNLFDDIILLSDGQIVYQGPREHVLEFFESVGFRCPERKGVADFLQEVTSRKDQPQYWARTDRPYRYVPVKAFADAFKTFHVGRSIAAQLAVPFDRSKGHPAALATSNYGVSKMELLKACIDREILLIKRNSFVYIFRAFQLSVVTFIYMTVYFRTNMHHTQEYGNIYAGALFFALVMALFNGFSELAMTIMRLPVFFKQRDLLFFPAWAYTIPTWILQIPMSFILQFVFVFISYYVIGFDPNFGRLIRQYLILVGVTETASGLFRLVGGLGRNNAIANIFGSFTLIILIGLGGFILSRKKVKKWWKWGYWISPMMYAQNSITVNEFLGHSWDKITSGVRLGTSILESHDIFPESKWYWIGLAALIGYMFLFNMLFTVALTYLNPIGKSHSSISEETLKEKQANLTGDAVDNPRGDVTGTGPTVVDGNARQGSRGMVLPFQPLSLTFDDVKYSVDMPAEMRAQGVTEERLMLLKGLSGSFRPGVLTALMGVSGAGKTTLMDVLAGRKTGGYIEGTVTISGYPKVQETFARISGYCEQNDIHSPHITIYESLSFSAWLRLSSDVDTDKRKMFVEEVMELVELMPLRDSLVGLPGVNGLSTEQRKRLTIAVELVANPSIIFMDEPTSGLDARAAAIVMRTIRNTVNTGRTVVCTIHQPSIDIFDAFDELFLMKRGGEEIFVGPLGHHSAQLIEYFEAIPGVSKIKDGYNPATWMLEVSSIAQEQALGVNFAQIYKNSQLYQRNKGLIREHSVPPPGTSDLYFPTEYSQPFVVQCLACFWKQSISYWRNPGYTSMRFFFTLVVALLFGSLFWDLGKKRTTQQDLFNAMGSMYAATMFLGTVNSMSAQPVVSVERSVFYRERAAGIYSALSYAFGQIVIELPYVLMQAVAYCVIVYAMIGFDWTVAKFFWFLFFVFFSLLYFTYYGMMAIGVTPNQTVAAIVSAFFYGIWNLFCGFIIPRPKIPVWWRWYSYACPVAWTLYGLISSQFGDYEDEMTDLHEPVSEFIKRYFGFHHDLLGLVAGMVIFWAVFFAFLFAFSIKKLNFQKR